jgi:hypothetical protein
MKHLLALVFLLLVCIPVLSQDVPAEPTNQVVDVIDGTGEGATVIVEASETPVETPATNVLSISNIIAFLIGGIVSFAGAMAWLGSQARIAMQDPAKMVLAERLGDSVPKDTADKLIDGLNTVVEFLKEATDRQPALLKPSPNTSVSSTGGSFDSSQSRLP